MAATTSPLTSRKAELAARAARNIAESTAAHDLTADMINKRLDEIRALVADRVANTPRKTWAHQGSLQKVYADLTEVADFLAGRES